MVGPDSPASRLFEVAERQAGYFTSAQALEAGYSYASQSYHSKAGNWMRDGWGIYRLAHFPEAENEDLIRLTLWSRTKSGEPQAVISHASALHAFELSDVLPSKYEVTVPKGFRKKAPPGVVLHKDDLSAEDVEERDGYWLTTPLRTLLDVTRSGLSPELVEAAARQALERGLVRRRVLEERMWAAEREGAAVGPLIVALGIV